VQDEERDIEQREAVGEKDQANLFEQYQKASEVYKR
jgi:hypothetical protein